MSEIVIRFTRQGIERTIYWIVILILASMLIWTYVDDGRSQTTQDVLTQQQDTEEENTLEETIEEIEEVVEEEIMPEEPEPEVIEEEVVLSGEVEMSITDVEIETASNGAVRITSFTIEVNNGLAQNIIPEVQAFVEAINGNSLNQAGNSLQPYIGPVTLTPVSSGETRALNVNERGGYVWDDQVGYRFGDDFRLVVELLDETGDPTVTSTRRINT